MQASDSAAAFYLNNVTTTPVNTVAEAWPKIKKYPYDIDKTSSSEDDTVIELTVSFIFSAFEFIGIDLQVLLDVMYTLLEEIQNNFRCDLYAIQTCSVESASATSNNCDLVLFCYFVFGLSGVWNCCQAVLITPLFSG